MTNPYAPPQSQISVLESTATVSKERADEIAKMLREYNRNSLLLGAPGLILQMVGNVGHSPTVLLTGVTLLTVGLTFYARLRGRHWAFGLLGLLSCMGILVLAVLSKRCIHCGKKHGFRTVKCLACGAPLGA